jgi:pimeloyl-ACP methyl ester carboxylesterase
VPRLLALHGQTLNGAYMRRELARLEELGVELICPDAPNHSTADLVERLYTVWDAPRQPPPHRAWWDASDDGRTYHGWEASRDLLLPILGEGPVGILGFSQGAIVATALAAMAQHGQAPPIDFVVLIAGRAPRADVLAPLLVEPIRIRSLHVWGDRDSMMGETCRELADRFAADTREVVTWPGGHTIPKSGPAAQAIEALVAPR